MSKILFILSIIGAFVLIYNFVIRPFKIVNAESFENYKNGDTVFAINHDFIISVRPFTKGDVILLKENVAEGDGIGTIIGSSGDFLENVYFLDSKEKLEGPTPSGFYLIKLPESLRVWAISGNEIKYLLWFPFIKLRQINAHV